MNIFYFVQLSLFFAFQCILAHASSHEYVKVSTVSAKSVQKTFQDKPQFRFKLNYKMYILISENFCQSKEPLVDKGCEKMKTVGQFPVSSYPSEYIFTKDSDLYDVYERATIGHALHLGKYENNQLSLNFKGQGSLRKEEIALFNGTSKFNSYTPGWLRQREFKVNIPSFDLNKPIFVQIYNDGFKPVHHPRSMGLRQMFYNGISHFIKSNESKGIILGNSADWPTNYPRYVKYETLDARSLFNKKSVILIDSKAFVDMGKSEKLKRVQIKLKLVSWVDCKDKYIYHQPSEKCLLELLD
ncbi:MAG: hypothetical protein HOO06_03595 [Bdellovibrionaceae bacterium]|jgi:hypothetical protein|nr:hypothetical protein [Pseudobdellovibrionaceae bacterium]